METTVRRVGRYILLEPVARGGMGAVYRAEDPAMRRTVAVKILPSDATATPQAIGVSRKRFKREAEAAGRIDHPNVIRMLDIGEDEASGELYLVMEFVPGPSLEKLIREGGVSIERALAIVEQIAAGLDAAHARGIVHRDIKPANVLFTADGIAKIVDFGITRIDSTALTQDTGSLGTPAYMSPEQVHGDDVGARSDLFSLGVLSYEILAGRKPFQGTDAVSVAYAIAHVDAPPISSVNGSLPSALDAPFARMLSKDPADRFPRGKEFSEHLRRCLEPAAARVPASESTRRMPRKVFLQVLAAAAIVTALAALALSPPKKTPDGEAATPPQAATPEPPVTKPRPTAPKARPSKPKPRPPAETARPPAATAQAPAEISESVPKPKPAAARPAVSKAEVTISLAHRVRAGTLVVSLDGAPIFNERFSKAKMTLQQTTTWDTFKAPSGVHTLTASVDGENGKTYRLDPHEIEIAREGNTQIRIGFKRDKLSIVSAPAAR